MTYTNSTLAYLVTEVGARGGLFSPALPPTSQMSQVIPAYLLRAGQTYRQALDELCAAYGLAYFLDQSETLQVRELSGSDPSVWTYRPEIELVSFGNIDPRANHIIVSGKPPVGGLVGALTTAEAYDDANVHLVGMERMLHHTDLKLTSVSQCAQKAAFLLAQEMRSQVAHTVSVPLNPPCSCSTPSRWLTARLLQEVGKVVYAESRACWRILTRNTAFMICNWNSRACNRAASGLPCPAAARRGSITAAFSPPLGSSGPLLLV